jgi:integrase
MAGSIGLTDAKIKGLKAPEKGQVEVADKVVPGLRIRVGKSGAKTFILRKRVGGKPVNVTLERFHDSHFTLADARKKARTLLNDIEGGADPRPRTRKASGVGAGTVRALWEQYLEQQVRGRKRSAKEIERVGDVQILPAIGDRLADTVTRGDITALVERITYRNPKKPTLRAGRYAHQQLSAFYAWALPRLDRLPSNPCRDAGRPGISAPRDRILIDPDNKGRDDELVVFWNATGELGWPFEPAFRLLLLTGQRLGEVFGATWSEFDLRAKTWTIPGARAKNGREHTVPLSPAAMAIIKALPEFKGSDFLFPARGRLDASTSGLSKGTARLRAKMKDVPHFTLHDLRRTAATGMQRRGIKLEVVEAVLNHVSGSRAGIVGVYQRHAFAEEKRHALNVWAAEVDRIVNAKTRGNVVPLPTA